MDYRRTQGTFREGKNVHSTVLTIGDSFIGVLPVSKTIRKNKK